MSKSPLETLQAAMAAIESRDVESLMSLFDEHCTISHERNVVIADGHDAIRDFYTAAFERFPNFKVELGEYLTLGTVLMAIETNVPASGDEGEMISSAWAYQVRDGKFTLMHMFDPTGDMEELLSRDSLE
ncbi:MAG TPA: nuclear transport factor 2 family protein [Acidimicrobiales bacterium]|nr:nuclear transport factor 2 family protein [Acidimicrobiales bacterium]